MPTIRKAKKECYILKPWRPSERLRVRVLCWLWRFYGLRRLSYGLLFRPQLKGEYKGWKMRGRKKGRIVRRKKGKKESRKEVRKEGNLNSLYSSHSCRQFVDNL